MNRPESQKRKAEVPEHCHIHTDGRIVSDLSHKQRDDEGYRTDSIWKPAAAESQVREHYDPQTQGIVFELGSRKVHTSITGGKHKYHSRLYVNKGETATTKEAKHATSEGARRWATKILTERAGQALETRPCTCHPDDNPPVPCAEKYALSECKPAAAQPAKAAQPTEQEHMDYMMNPLRIQEVGRMEAELERYKAHAEALAAALRDMLADARSIEIRHYAETHLAAWDKEQKGGAQ